MAHCKPSLQKLFTALCCVRFENHQYDDDMHAYPPVRVIKIYTQFHCSPVKRNMDLLFSTVFRIPRLIFGIRKPLSKV